jgi:hypothetical protein
MAVSITATAGSASANSFVTLVEANAYAEARLNASLWDAATDDSKNRSLVEATREISNLSFIGVRTDDTQVLSWPRELAVDPDDPNADYFDSTELPTRVKNATCELAFQFIKAGTTDVAAMDATEGVIRKKVDVLETEYAEPWARSRGLDRYPRVVAFLRPLLVSAGFTVRTVRG